MLWEYPGGQEKKEYTVKNVVEKRGFWTGDKQLEGNLYNTHMHSQKKENEEQENC